MDHLRVSFNLHVKKRFISLFKYLPSALPSQHPASANRAPSGPCRRNRCSQLQLDGHQTVQTGGTRAAFSSGHSSFTELKTREL
jgi:hypothetical protein